MPHAYDLVLRGGTVVDGGGGEPFEADVAVSGGRIAAVGAGLPAGRAEIDARDRLVTPGFVDIHTHYDGQATWDARMQPSSWHGVTTVVMGNCGVGFAPCRPEDHDRLIRLMEGVEDIPFPVLAQGLEWNWETYPDYLDALATRRFDVDVAGQLPHGALRVYAMSERGADREPASPAEIARMGEIAKAAVEAGALGFTTSRTLLHRTSDGRPTPSLDADEGELMGIAMGLAAAGKGVLQVVDDWDEPEADFAMMRRLAERSGRPLSFSMAQGPREPQLHRRLLGWLAEANAQGVEMRAQVAGRPIGVLFGLELTANPFSYSPSYRAIAHRPLAERVAALRDPAFRARLLAEASAGPGGFQASQPRNWAQMHLMTDDPDYEPRAEHSVAAHAARTGRDPAEVALDHMLDREGRGLLYVTFLNYVEGSLEPAREMIEHPSTVFGLSDGGAHVGTICDGSFPTSNLTLWTRDRTRGPKLRLQDVVRGQTRDTAAAVGLLDRGLIAPGYRADLNVIDYDRLRLKSPEVAHDMPAGGRRLIQRAEGYVATIVAGEVTYREGCATEALPGRLVRGAQAAPVARAAE